MLYTLHAFIDMPFYYYYYYYSWCVTVIFIFLAAARLTQRDMAVIDTNGQHLRCRMPIKIIIEDGCPSYDCLPSSRCNGSTSVWKRDYKRKNGLKREKKCEDVEKRQMLLPSWKSEYQDSISKIGHAIMRVKLHHAKRKALPVQYQYCTTSSWTYREICN